jgi:3-dehydroquinate synthase
VDAQKEDIDLNEASLNRDLGYSIVVAPDVRSDIAAFLREQDVRRFVVLSDAQPDVTRSAVRLTDVIAGRLAVVPIVLGERRKRLSTLEAVLEALLRAGADRATTIVGVGGGVASDLFGFAAATYMRGVPYVHVATSLVAMVDAAIGGKTGVDLAVGKNLAGVFCDPLAVFCPTDALETLPFRHLREGLAETVKHGIIEGDELFDSLERLAPHPFSQWPWPAVVAGSSKVKTMIVADDRTERGEREVLNLGHTFAHGIEQASDFRISHGAAVSLGLRAAGLLALRIGRFDDSDHLRVLTLLALLRLPMQMPLDPATVFDAMQADKKRREGRLRFVLPNAIGDVEFGIAAPDRAVRDVLRRMTRLPIDSELR